MIYEDEIDTDVPVALANADAVVVRDPVVFEYRSLVDKETGSNREPQAILREGYLTVGFTLGEAAEFLTKSGFDINTVKIDYDGTIEVPDTETADEAAERFAMVEQQRIQRDANLYEQYLALVEKFEPGHTPVDCTEEVAVVLHEMRATRAALASL